jgi:M6 family metalloprotease-like protein
VSRRFLLLVMGAFVYGCRDTTAPTPDFDPGRFPYKLSTTGVRLFGTSRVLVIGARFADGAPPPLSSSDIQAQLFGSAGGGPVTQSFSLASGGGFTLRGQVTPWVTTTVTITAFSLPGAPGQPSGLTTYVTDAIRLVDPDVDFGLYDNDGPDGFPNSGDDDGVVDGGVAIFNSETNKYCAGGTGRGPHPFAVSRLPPGTRYTTADARKNGGVIEVSGYTLLSATGCGGPNVGAHVLAHELGHVFLGLPDMYHPVGGVGEVWATRRWVSGCWELMAAGAWGCGTGAPTLDYRFNTLGAWTRSVLGWATPIVADMNTTATYELNPMGRGGTVLRVPIKPDEYLLVEYREGAPGDSKLPANGVLIFHVAESLTQFPPTLQSPYRVSLIEADDDSSLFRTELEGGNRGTPSDAFGITRTTFRAGEHSRAKAVDGTPFFFEVTGITIDAAAHKARVRVGPVLARDEGRGNG